MQIQYSLWHFYLPFFRIPYNGLWLYSHHFPLLLLDASPPPPSNPNKFVSSSIFKFRSMLHYPYFVCGFPLGHSRPTRGHILKKLSLSLLFALQLRMELCSHFPSLAWASTRCQSCCNFILAAALPCAENAVFLSSPIVSDSSRPSGLSKWNICVTPASPNIQGSMLYFMKNLIEIWIKCLKGHENWNHKHKWGIKRQSIRYRITVHYHHVINSKQIKMKERFIYYSWKLKLEFLT